MMEPYGFGFSRAWLFPGWRPEDLRIPRRLDQIDMPGGFFWYPQ